MRAAVDGRYGSVAYYPNLAYFGMLDEGGIVIGDGFGAEIRLGGGRVEITCPGDIWLKSGRNVNAWAGRDVAVRAKHAVDASATDGPVRINRDIRVGDVFEADLANPDMPEVAATLTARMLGFVAEADRTSGEIVRITPVLEAA